MKLFSESIYKNRRERLKKEVGEGQILVFGNNEAPMNYLANTYRFRQDSNFIYYFGLNLPGLVGFIDIDKDEEIIFGHELSIDDIIWEGPQEKLSVLVEKVGVKATLELEKLASKINKDSVKFLPAYRAERAVFIKDVLGIRHEPSRILIKAVAKQRSVKAPEEIMEMIKAVDIARDMHISAMKATKPGKKEYEVVADILKTMKSQHAELSYPVIFSVNGQTLHNHYHGNTMKAGQLVLNDSGCETEMYYAADITRTFPVSGKFTSQQKAVYEIVLKMETEAIKAMKPGVKYKDLHIASNRILLEGLSGLGIVNGDIETMLQAGVGGLFMPHGLGHAIGLDVHDMEDLGEAFVGYDENTERSTQLGLKSLRFARELTAGNVLTVEPGCYFIPELINKYKSEGIFTDFVNYTELEKYFDFGGIRIEDNVLVSKDGHEILGNPIPKTVAEVEALMG